MRTLADEKKEKRRGIYSNNYDWITDEQLKEAILDCDVVKIEEDITDDMIYEEKSELENLYFDDEMENLNLRLDGRILAIADMGLWNGRHQGYKIGKNNLNEVMTLGNEYMIEIFQDEHDIKKISSHHDGTNFITFREIREDRDIDKLLSDIYNGKEISRQKLSYYTKSLNGYVDEIYGKVF